MLAQVYNEVNNLTMRIFDRNGLMIHDIPLEALEEADDALKRLRMRRRERWSNTDWGKQAKIRFN